MAIQTSTVPTASTASTASTRAQPSAGPGGRSRDRRLTPAEVDTVLISPTFARLEAPILERAARVIRVLGHPLRLRLLDVLEDGERHVSDLVAATDTSQAIVSQHLAILRSEGVVGARRDGLRVYYRITEPKVHRILDCIRDCDLPELFDPTGNA